MISVFDTNAYRILTFGLSIDEARTKGRQLREAEQKAGSNALAHPIVMWELLSHLASPADPALPACMNALVAAAEHTRDDTNGGINMIAESVGTICMALFGKVSPAFQTALGNLGTFVTHVNRHAPDLSDPKFSTEVTKLSRFMDNHERSWVNGMTSILDHFHPGTARKFLGGSTDRETFDRLRQFFASEQFFRLWSRFLVEQHAAMIDMRLTPRDREQKGEDVRKIFSVPFHLMTTLLQQQASPQPPNLAHPKKRRWNFVWDSMICFTVGPGTIDGEEVFLITGDGEITDAATNAGFGHLVLSLEAHLERLGLACKAIGPTSTGVG